MEHPFVEQSGLSLNGPIIDVAATGEIRGTMRADGSSGGSGACATCG